MPEQIQQLEQRVKLLESLLFDIVRSDRLTIARTIQMLDGRNMQLATGTGTIIATAIDQRLGFYNATPIIQRSGSAQVAVATTGSTQTTPWGYSSQAQADGIITLVNELRAWAVAQGFIKGSA